MIPRTPHAPGSPAPTIFDRVVGGLVHEEDQFRDPLGLHPGTMSVFRDEVPWLGKVVMAETDDGYRVRWLFPECIERGFSSCAQPKR